jgi:phosphonoacetaldehyde hydrolase
LLQAVLFDIAGTVCDFGSLAPVRALQAGFSQFGLSLSPAQIRGPMGKAKREHIEDLLCLPDVRAQWVHKFGTPPGVPDIDRLYAAFLSLQVEAIRQRATLLPGMLDVVARLRQRGIKIGATTGYTKELVEVLLPLLAEQGYVPDAVVTSSDVKRGRPAPFMAFRCAEKLDVWPMSSIVKVGDTVADIKEGLSAGMWTIGFAACGNEMGLDEPELNALSPTERTERMFAASERLRQAGAHAVVEGPSDLVSAIDRLFLPAL